MTGKDKEEKNSKLSIKKRKKTIRKKQQDVHEEKCEKEE